MSAGRRLSGRCRRVIVLAAASSVFWVSSAALCATAADLVRQEMQAHLQGWVRSDFGLPDDLVLDEALRRDAHALAVQHRARVSARLADWVAEESRLIKPPLHLAELATRLVARYVNEVALWQLDSTGEAFDRVTLQSMADPGLCAAGQDQGAFARVVLAMQRMNAADRSVALAAQREMLARWGQRQRKVPPRPVPSVLESFERSVTTLRSPQRPAHEPAMPPVLAHTLLDASPSPVGDADRCAVVAWWLQSARGLGAAAHSEVLTAARYALAAEASAFAQLSRKPGQPDSDYPPLAREFLVEGVVQVKFATMPAGPPQVTDRRVTVPGIRGVRPVAFETLFDAASLARAAQSKAEPKAPGRAVVLEFVWKLQ